MLIVYNKKLIAIVFLLLLSLSSSSQSAGDAVRVEIPLNTGWEFMYGYNKRKSNAQPVTLPHTWNADDADSGKKDYYRGDGSYTRKLQISESYTSKRLFLEFEGVATTAWVFINGHYVGEHIGGYAKFNFEITDYVAFGEENTILVKVSNAYRIDALPLGGDFMKYGGIYRPVSLLITNKVCITPLDYASSGVYITPKQVSKDKAVVELETKISNPTAKKSKVKVTTRILDQDGKVVVTKEATPTIPSAQTTSVVKELVLDDPHLWKGRKDPYLYTVETSIIQNGVLIDQVTEPLGLRFFKIDPEKGFFLNGEYLDLYGVNRHQDKAGKGNALTLADHQQDMDLIMEMGSNMLRLSHYQHAEPIFEYADKNGLVVWAEIPLVGLGGFLKKGYYNSKALHDNGEQQLKELIRQNYNHPSVFFWGLFNELKDEDANPLPYIKKLQKLAKEEDATRLTVAASNIDSSALNNVTDVIAWNKYYGWYGEEPSEMGVWADEMHKKFPKRALGVSEYGAGASIYHHQQKLTPPEPGGKWHPESWQAYFHEENWKALKKRPFIWGKMIWNMFDFASSMRNEGDHQGMNDKGLVTFDRKTKKDAFYFYKANWSSIPVLHIAEKRWKERQKPTTRIKVYTNLKEIELLVNDISLGSQKPEMGICLWPKIALKQGSNVIKVREISSKNTEILIDETHFYYLDL
ncbi:hypothetical protein J8281_00600 [Aquimarina sp. U1-2]|uniref:glycoside hydrolase family 2 protein n=1 Tax=Aquimarina sp. U1-2 TaxID=2823141 RepID=UPI001AEC8957|nr:glycoside hydrolase family 2 TIM barrel-domain containing protein [Aquimarina sp. U1-2]MBP2830669.1 hypothetical protein [Aquimarina sp. U1-2]